MTTKSKSPQATTIRMPDTIDQYARRIHLNVRDQKVTMVYRWKDHKSPKAHTQRMTLNDEQAGRLMGALTKAVVFAQENDTTGQREETFVKAVNAEIAKLEQ